MSRVPLQPAITNVRSPRLRFRVRSKMDIWSVKEAVVDRMYERCGFKLEPGWTVVDLGAAIGEFAIFAAANSVARVLAFEPLPGSISLLRENLALNQIENVEVFELAVSDVAGTARLDTSGKPLRMGTRSDIAQYVEVSAITLAEVLNLAGGGIDLLKIDAEKDSKQQYPEPVVAWSSSFPRTAMEERRGEFVVNTTWLRENFRYKTEEDEIRFSNI